MHRDASNHDAVCILEQAERDFHIGVVGTGPGFESILQLIIRPEMEDYFPRLHLLAIAHMNAEHPALAKARKLGASSHENYREMLKVHPEINLLIELTGNQSLLREMRRFVGPEISILDHTSTVFLCGLLIMSEVSSKCKVDLIGQRSLLYTVMDELHEDVFILDPKGRILDVNRHVCERLGRSKEDLLYKPCRVLLSGNHGDCESGGQTCPFQITLRQSREAEALQTWVDDRGRVRYDQVRTYPVFNHQDEVHKVIEVRRDVTLRTEMEKRLQQAEKLAAIGELSMYIAHEIRNPLFAIGGFANILMRSPDLAAEARDKVRIILEESKRLDNILRSIVNFARPTKASTQEVDANSVILETVQLLCIGCNERGVAVDIRLADDAARVRGDAELLKQCLINLVKNSLEAMPDGGILTVRSAMESQYVAITVQDTGVGIPMEIREDIFNPFFTTKRSAGGSGLGLAMTKKIIGDLGGFLRLESKVGQGTAVTLLLPPYIPIQKGADTDGLSLQAQ